MTQVKRSWFFDSNPDSTGTRFRTKNIPNEQTYVNLVESAGFPGEPSDMATTNKQGFVIIYGDSEAITNRNNPLTTVGKQYVLKPYQAPGTGVLARGGYEESTPTALADGTPVTGGGIKVTGVVNTQSGYKRIGYQVELYLASLLSVTAASGALIPILNPDGSQGLVAYSDGKTPDVDKISYTHSQDVAAATWSVPHNLGWRPNINIEIGGAVIDTEWVHIDDNNIEVRFTSAYAGKVYCS